MPRFNPVQLAKWSQGQWRGMPELDITGWEIDSRKLQPGQMFVALKTEQRDGHDFLSAAAQAGAAAALVSTIQEDVALPQLVVEDTLTAFQTIAREHRLAFRGKVVGITGSAGKTSTKNLLSVMLGARSWATLGNLNNHLGVPLSLTKLDSAKHDFGIIEAGISGPDEMDDLAAMIEPNAAIVTLVDHAHTEGLGSLEGVAREKVKLPLAVHGTGDKIMPASVGALDPFKALKPTRVIVKRVEVLGRPTPEDSAEFIVTHQRDHTMLGLVMCGGAPETYLLARTTDGMAQNAALAITLARRWGRTPEEIQGGLVGWKPAPLRGEVRTHRDRLVYLDCYNANPAAMRDATSAFDRMTAEADRRLFIVGGMEELGVESSALHKQAGKDLPLRSDDRLAIIGTDADSVRAGALAAGSSAEQIEVVFDQARLAQLMTDWSGPVFIKGSRRYALERLLAEEAAVTL